MDKELLKQMKGWEQSLDAIIGQMIKNDFIIGTKYGESINDMKDDIIGTLENMSHEMMSINM